MMLQALAIERAAATRTAERVLHDYYIALEIRSGQKSTPQSANDEPHAARILPGEDAESVMLNLVYPAASGRRFSCRSGQAWRHKAGPEAARLIEHGLRVEKYRSG